MYIIISGYWSVPQIDINNKINKCSKIRSLS